MNFFDDQKITHLVKQCFLKKILKDHEIKALTLSITNIILPANEFLFSKAFLIHEKKNSNIITMVL